MPLNLDPAVQRQLDDFDDALTEMAHVYQQAVEDIAQARLSADLLAMHAPRRRRRITRALARLVHVGRGERARSPLAGDAADGVATVITIDAGRIIDIQVDVDREERH